MTRSDERADRGTGPASRSEWHGTKRRVPYWIPFSLNVLVLGGLTIAFVLVVLPNRYVFQTGLQSSGVSFPASGVPFTSPELILVEPRPTPPPPPEGSDEADAVPEPGLAERLWARVGPLLRDGDPAQALPHFAEYLEARPDDMGVWMEYGVALARAGEGEAADAAFGKVAESTGEFRARLERARLLRDREDWDRAVARYRELLAERPDDQALRLELAGVLWSADRPEEASRVAAAVPAGVPERTAADELLAALTEPPAPADALPQEPADRLALAWEAVETGEPARLDSLFREDRETAPEDPDRLVEWANLFQYGADDPERALEILTERMRLEPRTPELQLRIARLYAWTGREGRAVDALDRLLGAYPGEIEAWVLLGDVRTWQGARPDAGRAYRRALELNPEEPGALAGLQELRRATERIVTSRVDPGLGPTLTFFRDSDGFRRLEVAARGGLRGSGRDGLEVRSGYRRVEGIRPAGFGGREEGTFGELDLSRWWREGTVRGALTLGAERLSSTGVEPVFGARMEATELSSWHLDVSYGHSRAYPLVSTLESIDPLVRADRIAVAVGGGPFRPWTVTAHGEAVSLSWGDTNNWRLAAGVGAVREVTRSLQMGLVSQVLGFSDAAPISLDRRSFWDPELFWTVQAPVELRTVRPRGWNAHARVSPGVGLVRERGVEGSFWNPQLEGVMGTRYFGDRASVDANLFTTRGREGDYRALGFSLSLTVRP